MNICSLRVTISHISTLSAVRPTNGGSVHPADRDVVTLYSHLTIQAHFVTPLPSHPPNDRMGEIMTHWGRQVQISLCLSLSPSHAHTLSCHTDLDFRRSWRVRVFLEGPSCSLCWKSCLFSLFTQTHRQADGWRDRGTDR